jgi:ABC-type branched-subunit amino acid transport system ATPase component
MKCGIALGPREKSECNYQKGLEDKLAFDEIMKQDHDCHKRRSNKIYDAFAQLKEELEAKGGK